MDIDKELIFLDKEFKDKDQLFDFMAEVLFEKGYVNLEYKEMIKEREKQFPTGLRLKNINVAIPHADPKFTKASKLIIVRVKNKVIFKNAEDDSDIPIDIILGLTFKDSQKHIEDLMKIAEFLRNDETLEIINTTDDIEFIYKILVENLS